MTNPNKAELIVVLDRSGSMAQNGKIEEARTSFNALIAEQRGLPGEVAVTLAIFDDRYELIHDRADLRAIPALTEDVYARNMTALLDAVGRTIRDVGEKLAALPEDERPASLLFVVITDGLENCSTEFSLDQVRKMVEHQQEKYSWTFQFIGAGADTWQQGAAMAMPSLKVADDGSGVRMAYAAVSESLTTQRTTGGTT